MSSACPLIRIRIEEKYYEFTWFYRSQSQTNDEVESFLKIFELILDKIHEEKPFMTSLSGDFNASLIIDVNMILLLKRAPWLMLQRVIMNYINWPKNRQILNSSSSFIDLMFTQI